MFQWVKHELGAWVTGIRRLGKECFDGAGFVWVSSRKCGSKFMEQYRQIQQRLQENNKGETTKDVWKDPEAIKFVRSQRKLTNARQSAKQESNT